MQSLAKTVTGLRRYTKIQEMQVDQEVDILKRPHFFEKICLCESAEAAPHKNCSLQSQPTHEISLQSLRLDEDLRKSHKESQREKYLSTHDAQISDVRIEMEDTGRCKRPTAFRPSDTFSYLFLPVYTFSFSQIYISYLKCPLRSACAGPTAPAAGMRLGPGMAKLFQAAFSADSVHTVRTGRTGPTGPTGRTGRAHQYHQWISINLIRQRNCCS